MLDKASLKKYHEKVDKWRRWLKTDKHHALWPQIYSMLVEDLTFRTLAAAAEADKESALHSPILARGLIQGYAATQGLAIRRLVDRTSRVISLRRLLMDISSNRHLLTRENYVSGEGLPFDPNDGQQASIASGGGFWVENRGLQAAREHAVFDQLGGFAPEARSRTDAIPKHVLRALEAWLSVPEIEEVVDWCNTRVAHAADESAHHGADFSALKLTMDKISTAQRRIVRAAEVISAHVLREPRHGALIPVFQYSQFRGLEKALADPRALEVAQQRWHELAKERDRWTDGLLTELTRPSSAPELI